MTVNLYRYRTARVCREKTRLLEDHILKGYLLTSRTGAAGKHYISRQTYHLKFIPLKIAVHLLPCNAMTSIKISKRARLSAICTFLFKILITRVRDKEHHKKLNRQLEKVADSFGNITDI